ncbi:hypothetical protein JAAARDRAFT_195986 [Jaapia argillacea MUCL 33604]|uniref:Uncharacterized protein n=1 Tax=Jaapia argillacea MUCL 33604 TaxID=933084 RepID=A0A067PMT4_9AGAM|nr:hypothetical protein JAAARDRAFT_195986 [Jaapia argillacea MUCL 33604]
MRPAFTQVGSSALKSYQLRLDKEVSLRKVAAKSTKPGTPDTSTDICRQPSSSLSPALQLAPELLSEVFCHSLRFSEFIQPNSLESPLLLSQICRHWRHIALTTPRLWSSIRFAVTADEVKNMHRISTLQLWLLRSGNCPLSLRFEPDSCICSLDPVLNKDSMRFWPEVLDQAHRWEHVSIKVPTRFWNWMLRLVAGPTPILRTLTIDTLSGSDVGVDGRPLHRIEGSVKLHEVCLFTPIDLEAIVLPWNQLTKLVLYPPYNHKILLDDTLLDAMAQCANLEFLCLAIRTPKYPPKSPLVHLKKLAELTLIGQASVNFLDYIITPSLLSFSFIMNDEPGIYWSHGQFLTFLDRSYHPLINTFTLQGVFITEEELIECFQLLPQLSVLILSVETPDDGIIFTDRLFHLMTCCGTLPGPLLLPSLQHLSIKRRIDGSPDAFTRMVRSRSTVHKHKSDHFNPTSTPPGAVETWRWVIVDVYPNFDSHEAWEVLQDCRWRGLDVRIKISDHDDLHSDPQCSCNSYSRSFSEY